MFFHSGLWSELPPRGTTPSAVTTISGKNPIDRFFIPLYSFMTILRMLCPSTQVFEASWRQRLPRPRPWPLFPNPEAIFSAGWCGAGGGGGGGGGREPGGRQREAGTGRGRRKRSWNWEASSGVGEALRRQLHLPPHGLHAGATAHEPAAAAGGVPVWARARRRSPYLHWGGQRSRK